MPSLGYRKVLGIILSALTISKAGLATTAVILITPNGIVVGTDSKFTGRSASFVRMNEGEHRKTVIVQNRIAVTNIGVASVTFPSIQYDFLVWMDHLQSELPNDVTVSGVAKTIAVESAKMFLPVPDLLRSGDIKQQSPEEMCRMFTQFVIAGFEGGKPTLYIVEFDLNWDSMSLIGGKALSLDPLSQRGNIHLYSWGMKEAITDLANPNSYAYHKALLTCPQAFSALIFNRRSVTLDDAACITHAAIKVEENTNPNDVGGETHIVRIRATGTATAEIYKPFELHRRNAHGLRCQNNTDITGGGNTAKRKQGQCSGF